MIGIIVALKKETEKFLTLVQNLNKITLGDKEAYTAELDGIKLVIAISGIGKVSAALTTQMVINKFSPDAILNFGTTGGMNKSVEILKYYAVDKCCQFDFDLRELDGVPLGYIQEYKTAYFKANTDKLSFLPVSSLATADRFTNDENDIKSINDIGCSLRDMEGAAIAQVCTSNDIPVYIIKGISDVYGNGTAQEQFYKNLQTVGDNFPCVIVKAIKNISK